MNNSATKSELTSAISRIEQILDSEGTVIENIDSELSTITSTISQEVTDRQSADTVLDGKITTETNARSSADTTLQGNITTVGNNLSSHTSNVSNPHSVTKSQVGLGSVVNTGDSATPVNGGTTKFTTGGAYTELAKKVDKVNNKSLIADTEITRLTNIASGANKVVKSSASGKTNGYINVTTRTNGNESSEDVNVYTHPSYNSATASPVAVGRDDTGHVVIGSALTGASVGVSATTTSVTVDGTTFNKYTHPAGSAPSVSSGWYKLSTDANSHVASTAAVTASDITNLNPYQFSKGLTTTTSSGQVTVTDTYTTVTIAVSD